jgi:mannosyltransferase
MNELHAHTKRLSQQLTSSQLWWLLVCGSLAIRLIGIGGEDLWYDETFTALLSQLSLSKLITATAGDVHPPLSYLVTWLSGNLFGYSATAMRLPSAIAGSLAVGELYRLVKQVTGKQRAALISAAALTLTPAQLYYSQEARGYALLTWLILLAATSINDRNWIRFSVSCALAMLTHNMAALYLITLTPFALIANWKRALQAISFAALAYLAWLPMALSQLTAVDGGYWIIDSGLGGAAYAYYYAVWAHRQFEPLVGHSIAVSGALLIISLLALRTHKISRVAMLYALAYAPLVGLTIISATWQPMLLHRVMVPSGSAIVATQVLGIMSLTKRRRQLLLFALAPLLVANIAGHWLNQPAQRLNNSQTISELIGDQIRDCDAIYHNETGTYMHSLYAMPDIDQYMVYSPGTISVALTAQTEAALGMVAMPFNDVLSSHCRVWYLAGITPTGELYQQAAIDEILSEHTPTYSHTLYDNDFGSVSLHLIEQ